MTFFTKLQTLTLVLLLLCAVCVAPGMAGSPKYITEDGVHLTKYADSPTQLDPNYYRLNSADDVVVEGNQYYWVRIGNVKAGTLSTNQIADILCKGVVAIGTGVIVALVVKSTAVAEVGSGGTATPLALPFAIGSITAALEFGGGLMADHCHSFANVFVDPKYRVVASDGTILITVQKNNTIGIQELAKHGLDIKALTHLSKEGRVLLTCPHGQMLTCDSAAAICHCG